MNNWFSSMFSDEPMEGDLIASRPLNITKITSLIVPIGTAAMAFLTSALDEAGPLANLTPGQRLILFLAPVAVIAAVVLMDIWARATVTATATAPRPNGFRCEIEDAYWRFVESAGTGQGVLNRRHPRPSDS